MYGSANSPTGNLGKSSSTSVGGGNKVRHIPNFTPEMYDMFMNMISMLGPDSELYKLAMGDEETFDKIEAPAFRQFGETQGNIASRFSGLGGAGSTGGRKSSGFGTQMNAAASDLAMKLQGQRSQLSSQAMKDLQGMANNLLNQRPYENVLQGKKPSAWDQFLGSMANSAGESAGNMLFGSGNYQDAMKYIPIPGAV
jgi:hypothetical protein